MIRARRGAGPLALLVVAATAACGGGPDARPASSPESPSQSKATEAAPPGYPPGTAASGAPPPPMPSPGATHSPGGLPPDSPSAALLEIETAWQRLELSGSDCALACRALASMERATGKLCSMPDEPARCDDAKGRVRGARGRVRQACGSCPGGPSVDDRAPIPSP
jgi:hypothetical protein